MLLTEQHQALRQTLARFIDHETNPHVDAWEARQQFPSHRAFKQLGELGLLGITYL